VLQISGLLTGDVKESRNDSPTSDPVLVGGAVTIINRASHKHAAAAATPEGDKGSATPEKSQPTMDSGTEPGSTVELTEDEHKAAAVQISEVRHQRLTTEISAFGRVEEPESRLSTISARVAGRVDKLYLQYTGQNVQRGQAIVEIYSPELLSASEEYKLALDSRNQLNAAAEQEAIQAADDLVLASRRRLELWGMTPQQIEQIAAGRSNLMSPCTPAPLALLWNGKLRKDSTSTRETYCIPSLISARFG
jgi:multidrug efflux pump subunit AcrA (membrane-fusion protein)